MSLRRASLVAILLLAFLGAVLAPCPARVEAGHAHDYPGAPMRSPGAEGAEGAAHAGPEVSLSAACPCGCERAPLAASSARLGVALPSAAPALLLARASAPAARPVAHRVEVFALGIEHVPLPASLRSSV